MTPTEDLGDRIAWGLWFAAFALFLPAMKFNFVDYDDFSIVYDRPQVFSGLTFKNVLWAFSTLHADFAYWMPLTWISHQIDCQLFGTNAGTHHITNVLLHATNTLLLFRVLHRMTGCLRRSACVALLFAWHPLHVETVAWVAERKSLVCSLFWMLTLLAYLRYATSRTWRNYLLVFFGYLGALMGKPMAVTLPFTLILLDFWPLKRLAGERERGGFFRGIVLEKIPLLALSIIGSFAVYSAQKQVGAVREDIGVLFRVENVLAAYWQYIRKMFWPSDLIPIYERHAWPTIVVVWGAIFLLSVSFVCFRLRHRFPYLLMGWLWYVGNLVPSIGIVQISAHAMADRYTYIPLIGIFIMMAWGIPDLLKATKLPRHHAKLALGTGATLAFAVTACCTLRQLAHWKDGVSLFTRAVALAPWSSKAHYVLGMNLMKANDYESALIHGKESLRLNATREESFVLIASVLRKTGNLGEAKSFYEKALELKADEKSALAGLAYLLSTVETANIRDGSAAVRYAKHLCDDWKQISKILEHSGMCLCRSPRVR